MGTQAPGAEDPQAQLEALRTRVAAAEEQARVAELGALRARIASEYGIRGEAIELLSGTDDGSLRHQAERLVVLGHGPGSQARLGNVASHEGSTTDRHSANSPREVTQFLRKVVGRDPGMYWD